MGTAFFKKAAHNVLYFGKKLILIRRFYIFEYFSDIPGDQRSDECRQKKNTAGRQPAFHELPEKYLSDRYGSGGDGG